MRFFGSRVSADPGHEPLVIRQLLPSAAMAEVKRYVGGLYADADLGASDFANDDQVVTALEWGGMSCRRAAYYGFPVWREVLSPIAAALTERWSRARLVEEVCVFRRVERRGGKDTVIHWHTDAEGANSGQIAEDIWNCWMPLEEVGSGDYPSLELLLGSDRVMLGLEPQWGPKAERSYKWVAEHFPEARLYRPALRPGDALIFHHWVLHRTEPMAEMRGPRIGCEIRFRV